MPVLDMNDRKSSDGRYSYGGSKAVANKPLEKSESFNFLPPVNFDDFQSSIDSYDPEQLIQGPDSGDSGKFLPQDLSNSMIGQSTRDRKAGDASFYTPRQTRAQTLSRHPSNPRQEALQLHGGAAQTPASSAPLSVRARRQTQLPAVSTPAIVNARPPRKSVGPGLLTGMLAPRRAQPEQTPATPIINQPSLSRTPSLSKNGRRTAPNQTPNASAETPRSAMATRSSKAKSLQAPARTGHTVESVTPEQAAAKSASKTAGNRTYLQEPNTPTSSGNKRQSGRMSGLGARTISPTDTRRLHRLSMVQNPMPRVKPPPTPQSEPMPDIGITTRSPSLIPRKSSMTPSSARETPDSGPKQSGATYSLSTSSSYQSLRSLNAAGPPRISQSPSLSKLPTPKPRNVYSSAEQIEGESVPPVPAIPKAYESPQEQIEVPFFSSFKAPVAELLDEQPGVAGRNSDSGIVTQKEDEWPANSAVESPGHRRTRTVGTAPLPDKAPTTPIMKKPLQPMRLPPLNLLPLSTPTAARIASFPAPSSEVDQRETTPPQRKFSKTPSTPMTASKATFSRRYDDEKGPASAVRSSTSHHALRGVMDDQPFEDYNNGIPLPTPSESKRQITPFASGSLPKANAGFPPRIQRQPTDEYTLGHQKVEVQASKPMGPRPRTVSKSAKEALFLTNTSSSNEEPETPSSATSLRRKISMGWRRSSSKNANRYAAEQALEHQQSIQAEMPPPKMPASATWHGSFEMPQNKLHSEQARASLETARRKTSATGLSSSTDGTAVAKNDKGAQNANVRQLHSDQGQAGSIPRSSSWSILGINRTPAPAPKLAPVSTKTNGSPLPRLDKDDVLANEEMKRLSSKRRDVDAAARETDELRKRATSKDCLSPAQAIQASAGLLNIYEKGEIIDYKDGVYFCGTKSAKKHVGDISEAGTTNFGYDDERGDYNIIIGDHLAYRYEVIDVLGKGSFGQVVRCIDHKNGGLCAVKIIRNKKRFHQQALVEVNILNKLKEWVRYIVNAVRTLQDTNFVIGPR